jgi:heme/copper-type cytochrome/quinol oxidase subunit 4
MYPLLLLISFLGTCGTVLYILFTHKGERKSSISLHVAASKKAHALFAAGHFIGGLAFLLFSYKFFYEETGSVLLMLLAGLGFAVEQVQAFLPNTKRFEKVHTVAAVLMGVFISLIVVTAPFIIPLSSIGKLCYVLLGLVLLSAGVYTLRNKTIFYRTQLLFFTGFYIFLLLLLYVGKVYSGDI